MKSKTTAGVLALLLGGIGVHHFYLGNTGRGLVYLLFCWTFIPAIIAFIEGIQYLTMSESSFQDKFKIRIADNTINTADELEKLHRLKETGVITQQEFDTRKAKLL